MLYLGHDTIVRLHAGEVPAPFFHKPHVCASAENVDQGHSIRAEPLLLHLSKQVQRLVSMAMHCKTSDYGVPRHRILFNNLSVKDVISPVNTSTLAKHVHQGIAYKG
uniref:Uncharacterized protein n=1 Tax=Arundo donax TaxID=35708 RepID=A0A0A8XRK7_ARUDO